VDENTPSGYGASSRRAGTHALPAPLLELLSDVSFVIFSEKKPVGRRYNTQPVLSSLAKKSVDYNQLIGASNVPRVDAH
jgi:hypothetical protein